MDCNSLLCWESAAEGPTMGGARPRGCPFAKHSAGIQDHQWLQLCMITLLQSVDHALNLSTGQLYNLLLRQTTEVFLSAVTMIDMIAAANWVQGHPTKLRIGSLQEKQESSLQHTIVQSLELWIVR